MSALAHSEVSKGISRSLASGPKDFVPFLLDAMAARHVGQRGLAARANMKKSRLGLLLHSDPTKRATMSFFEFQQLLEALGIPLVEAAITVDTCHDELFQDERFANSLAMLAELFQGLPSMLVAALDEIEGLDGTEVRKEWAGPLRQAVVERLVREVTAVMARRDALFQMSNQGL